MSKKKWSEMNKIEKIVGVTGVVLIILILSAIFSGPTPEGSTEDKQNNKNLSSQEENKTNEVPAVEEVKSPKEKMFESISGLIDSRQAFDTGSYIKGDIPKGEYAFVTFEGSGQYYSEEDPSGNIIDNENFDSFGYVYVHGVGNIRTNGVLVKIGALKKLGVKSAKEIYEILNNVNDYRAAGWYKVGADIKPGQYVIESFGEGYVAVMSGPVGNSEIIDNDNFNGKYSVSVQNGQYLQISRGQLSQ